MGVADLLGLDDLQGGLLGVARGRWPEWVAADGRLGVVEGFDDLRGWLRAADPEAADGVLVGLAILAAPDGGDDVAAAAALAKCLLPGACRLAGWLSTLPPREVFRDSGPVMPGPGVASARIDELVASQLWIEVRSFAWRRRQKVAANVLMNTRAGVLRELGNVLQVSRADRTWANTIPIDPDERVDDDTTGLHGMERPAGGSELDAAEATAKDEMWELLVWACGRRVISVEDGWLLLSLVDEAKRVDTLTRVRGRGCGGLLSGELVRRVAPRVRRLDAAGPTRGVSEVQVRRRASQSIRALAAAAPGDFVYTK
ncbi:MAG: hypothetical protein ACRCYU_10735 [Nocardioides sp.]